MKSIQFVCMILCALCAVEGWSMDPDRPSESLSLSKGRTDSPKTLSEKFLEDCTTQPLPIIEVASASGTPLSSLSSSSASSSSSTWSSTSGGGSASGTPLSSLSSSSTSSSSSTWLSSTKMPALKISKRATNISALIKVSKHVVLSVNPTQPEQDQDKEPFFVVFHRSEFDEKNPHLTPPALIPLLSQRGLEQDQFSWDTSVDDLFPLMISTLPKQSDPTTLIETEQRISLLELDGPLNLSSDQVTRLDLSLSFCRRGGMLSEVHNAQNLRAISLLLPSYFKDFFPIMPQWHKNLIAQHPVLIYLLRNAQYPSCFLPSYVCDHPFVKLYQSKRENTKIFHLENNIIAYVPKDRTNLTGFTNAANLSEMSVDEETFCIKRHLVSILEKPTQRPVQGRNLLMPCAIFQKVCPPSDAPNYIVHSFPDDLRPLLLSYLDTAHKIKFMSAYPQYTALVRHALRKDFFNLELDVCHIALTPLHATCNLKPKGLHNHNGTLSIYFKSNALKDRKQNDRCFTYITEEGSKKPLFVVGPFWAKSFNNPFGKYDLFENLFYMTRQMLFHKMFEQNGLTQVQTFPLIVEEQFIGQQKRKESCFLPLECSRPALCQNAIFSLYTQDHHFALRLLPQENLYEHSKKGSSYNLQFLDQRTHTNSNGTVTSMASAPIHLKSSFLKCNSMDTLTASLEKVFSDLLNALFPNTYNGSFRTKWSIDMDGVKRISPPITLHVDCLELETLSLPEGLSVHDISRLIIQDVTKDFDPETLSSIHPKPGPNKPTLVLGNGASIHPCFFEKFNIHGVGKVILQRPGRNMGWDALQTRQPQLLEGKMHLPITYFNPNETDQETTKIVFFDSTSDDIMKAREGIGCWRKHLKAEGGSVHFSHIKTSMKETARPDDLKSFEEKSRTMDAQLANGKVLCIIEDPDLTELFITKTANDTVYQLPFIEKFCGIFRLKTFPDRPKPPLSKISVLLYLVNNTVDYVDVNVEWKNKQGEPLLQMGPLRLNNNVDNAIPGFAARSAQEHMDLMNTVLFDVFYSKIERHTWHSDSTKTCALKSVPSKNTP